jgi:hypothetical protein
MARPQIAGEGYELQVWMVATKSPAFRSAVKGREAKNPLQANPSKYENDTHSPGHALVGQQ